MLSDSCSAFESLCSLCDSTVMVEGLAHEVPEETFCDAVLFAHKEVKLSTVCVQHWTRQSHVGQNTVCRCRNLLFFSLFSSI